MLNLVYIMVLTNINSDLTLANNYDFYHLLTNISSYVF